MAPLPSQQYVCLRILSGFLLLILMAQGPKGGAAQIGRPAAVLASVLPDVKHKTQIPVLLPAHLPPLLGKSLFAATEAEPGRYTIRLESERECHQAESCFLGVLSAQKGGAFSFPEAVSIGRIGQGRFKPVTCDGLCTPPAIEWRLNGVLYTAQLTLRSRDDRERRTEMIRLAEDAIRSGPR